MRTTFIKTLMELAETDSRIWLMTGDLGYSVLEPFAARFPNRYINAGVAEQNMTGMAAGIAASGGIVFTYSIANFPVARALEQIRNDVCYHNLSVKVVAVGGGLAYGAQGYSHHAVEDLAFTRVLPNMTVVAPGDPYETSALTKALVATPGPAYLRLGKAGEALVHSGELDLKLGQSITVRLGDDCTIFSTGGVLVEAVRAHTLLASEGIYARVISMPTVQPLDTLAVIDAAFRGPIVTIEEHGTGGLASAIGEALIDAGAPVQMKAIRLPQTPLSCAGSQEWLRAQYGVTAESVVNAVHSLLAVPSVR
ncbi:MAG: transketolase [Phycisphaerae bacterium]|nr:transketolase [Gemmatimonadaceae bacterium]